jgi:NADP-reducing hydrogenase subunit HndD
MENNIVNVTIDGIKLQVSSDYTVLDAAREAKIDIPTLCYLKGINEIGACRMCIVEIEGARSFQTSCTLPVAEGMVVRTNTPALREARRTTLELILSAHKKECLMCVRNKSCELQNLSEKLNIRELEFEGEGKDLPIDDFSPSIVRDPNKCILCRRCVSVCKNVQAVGAIDTSKRGFKSVVSPAFERHLNESPCTMCGQCIVACPVGALKEKDDTKAVWDAISSPDMHVVVQTAPAVRVALGEEFDLPIGTIVTGKMVAGLKRMGFDKVFDTDTAADLTIMEEGTELIERIQNGGKLPLITSCSPGWIKFAEHNFPELLDNLSTAKSPHEMFGAIIKSYYAQKAGIDPAKIFVVSIMPCTAKKFEAVRPEMAATGFKDVDVVLTTRELARMLKEANIDLKALPDEQFDDPMGEATGAAVIFGATGGVMEAALRTVSEILTSQPLQKIEFEQVRGTVGIKEAEVPIGDMRVKVAVAHGLGNAKKLMEKVRNNEEHYDFIEVMACPGGCVTGGGQPIHPSSELAEIDLRQMRAKAIYQADKDLPIRKSHENPAIQKLYAEFLEKPGSHKAHELLHTHYAPREAYQE